MGFSMIDQELINRNSNLIKALFEGRVEFEDSADELYQLLADTNDNYIKLVEQNAELHKELAKLKGDLVFAVNDGKPYDHNPSNDLAM